MQAYYYVDTSWSSSVLRNDLFSIPLDPSDVIIISRANLTLQSFRFRACSFKIKHLGGNIKRTHAVNNRLFGG